jgi:hypothetical protein
MTMKRLISFIILLCIISFLTMFPTLLFSDLKNGDIGWRLLLAETGIITTSLGVLGMCSIGNPFR